MRIVLLVILGLLGGCTFVAGQAPDGTKFLYSRSLLDTCTKSAEVVVERPGVRVTVRLDGYSSMVSTEAFEAFGRGLGAGAAKGAMP